MAKKNAEMRADEMVDEGGGGGSKVYELGFHLDPELPTEEMKKAYQSIREVCEGQGALVAEGEPEQVQLAYTISRQDPSGRRDFNSAHFAWVAYETSAANHEHVLEEVRADKRIIRFIDLVTTKDAVRHAAELRLMEMKAPEPKEDAPVSDTELDAALESATTA